MTVSSQMSQLKVTRQTATCTPRRVEGASRFALSDLWWSFDGQVKNNNHALLVELHFHNIGSEKTHCPHWSVALMIFLARNVAADKQWIPAHTGDQLIYRRISDAAVTRHQEAKHLLICTCLQNQTDTLKMYISRLNCLFLSG